MRKKLTALFGGLLISALTTIFPVCAQQTRVLTADKHNEYGLVYTLPVTSVRFDITARQRVSKAGPFYQYAGRYLGTDRVITSDSESWEIISVKAVPFGTPDNENEYLMQLKPGALTSICVADNGMLLAINTEVDSPQTPEPKEDSAPDAGIGVKDYLQYVNEDFLASQSSAKQAQLLSESLMEVRDSRVSLTRGTAETMPSDGRQLELMLNSLKHQEEAMSAAFTGTVTERTVTRSFVYTPEKDGRTVLFRMSDFAGFVEADDYSGDPVYVTMATTAEPEMPVDAKGEEKKMPKDAVIYNLPGAAKLTVSLNGNNLWSGEIECAQLGIQFGLSPSLFSDKKNRSYAVFNPVTGALVKIADVNE